MEGLATKVLADVGAPEPAALAQSLVSLIAGSALRRVSGRLTDDAEALILYRAIRALVLSSLMDEDDIKAHLRKLKTPTKS